MRDFHDISEGVMLRNGRMKVDIKIEIKVDLQKLRLLKDFIYSSPLMEKEEDNFRTVVTTHCACACREMKDYVTCSTSSTTSWC